MLASYTPFILSMIACLILACLIRVCIWCLQDERQEERRTWNLPSRDQYQQNIQRDTVVNFSNLYSEVYNGTVKTKTEENPPTYEEFMKDVGKKDQPPPKYEDIIVLVKHHYYFSHS